MPLVTNYFTAGPAESIILTKGLNGQKLRFPLHLWYCPVSIENGTQVNRCVRRIVFSTTGKRWCGPVVVLKFSGSRRMGYVDAGLKDLLNLSAYFNGEE